jgi:cytochrome c oxidase assembly factor 4
MLCLCALLQALSNIISIETAVVVLFLQNSNDKKLSTKTIRNTTLFERHRTLVGHTITIKKTFLLICAMASSQKSDGSSEWAASPQEEDRVEQLIRRSGCWDDHIAVVDCMGEKNDWRKCQDLTRFRECMQKGRPPPPVVKK